MYSTGKLAHRFGDNKFSGVEEWRGVVTQKKPTTSDVGCEPDAIALFDRNESCRRALRMAPGGGGGWRGTGAARRPVP